MAAALAQSHHGFFRHLFFSLLALQCAEAGSESRVTVTQQPPFDCKQQNENVELYCSVDKEDYYIHWYRQLHGQTELQHIGTFRLYEKDLDKDEKSELGKRLSGKRDDKTTYLNLTSLQPNDTGLYLCAAKDTVILAGTGDGAKLTARQ